MIAILFRAFLFYIFYKFVKTGYHMFKVYKQINQGANANRDPRNHNTYSNNKSGGDAIEAEYRRVEPED